MPTIKKTKSISSVCLSTTFFFLPCHYHRKTTKWPFRHGIIRNVGERATSNGWYSLSFKAFLVNVQCAVRQERSYVIG